MPHTFIPGYVGPEVVLPITAVIAAIGGFFLMMGRSGVSFLLAIVRKPAVRKEHEAE